MGLAAPTESARPTALPTERSVRQLGVALLLGMALTHLVGLANDVGGTAYASVLFMALIACTIGLAVAVARDWHPRQALTVGAVLAVLAVSGYVLSRWFGLPELTDLVGQWGDPAGIASLLCEGLLVALALSQLPSAAEGSAVAEARPLLRPALGGAGIVVLGLAAVLTVTGPTGQPPRALSMAQAMSEGGGSSMAGMDMSGSHGASSMSRMGDDMIYPPRLTAAEAIRADDVIGGLHRPGVMMFEGGCTADCMAAGPGMWHRRLPMSDPAMSHLMAQYADPAAATAAQRAAAERLLQQVRLAARERFANIYEAKALGYTRGSAMDYIGKRAGTRSPFRHYDRPSLFFDGRTLDPWHPESLIYWMRKHGRPVLVGMMFRESSLAHPTNPLGAIARWHVHALCRPRGQGTPAYRFHPVGHCQDTGNATIGPTAMLHVWLTPTMASAYSQDTPARALGIPIGTRPGPPPTA